LTTATATLMAVCIFASLQSRPSAQQPAAPPATKNPYLKLVEPWPDEGTLRERKRLADARPLFREAPALPFKLTANFRTIDKDHNPDSKATYPSVMTVDGSSGKIDNLSVTLSARGHFRRMARNCRVVPLKLDFGKDVGGTVFDGLSSLKLGTG